MAGHTRNLDLNVLFELRMLFESDHKKFVKAVKTLPQIYKDEIATHWYFHEKSRIKQIIPWHKAWNQYIFIPGRGFGKTFLLSRNKRDLVLRLPGLQVLCFARKASEAKKVMIEGEAGIEKALLEVGIELISGTSRDWPSKPSQAVYLSSTDNLQIKFYNRSIISYQGANNTRGHQSHVTFADELYCWFEDQVNERADKLMVAYQELQTVTRLLHPGLGNHPRLIVTSTPQAVEILRVAQRLAESNPELYHIIQGSTYENQANLSDGYMLGIEEMFGGTVRGKQEIHGIVSWETPGALWTPDMILRKRFVPDDIQRVVVAVDPAVTNNAKSDESGISVVARDSNYDFYVLADRTIKGSTREWVRKAIKTAQDFGVNEIVYESNQGGDLVKDALETEMARLCISIPIKSVHASQGKYSRAENEALLYEQGRVYHVGMFQKLEEQMTTYNPAMVNRSPDRLDALVWALNRLRNKSNAFLAWS